MNSIDDDWRNAEIVFENFNGTIPAIQNGEYTGYDATGATLTTDDVDTEDATVATVNGDLEIRNISLNSGEVTFAGRVVANNVYGSEATMVINAGALRVTESVATSNILKLAGTTITPGTVVYQATTDIAEPESSLAMASRWLRPLVLSMIPSRLTRLPCWPADYPERHACFQH